MTGLDSPYEFTFLDAGDLRDVELIVKLRRTANHTNFQNRVVLTGLDWNRSDRGSVHLGMKYRATGELAACLRLSFYTTRQYLDGTTLVPSPESLRSPAALLSRAATLPELQGQGLHSILRCRALEACLQTEAQLVLGSFEASTKRSLALKNLGYEILATKDDWGPRSYMKPSGPVVLVGLRDQSRIQQASEKLRAKYGLSPLNTLLPPFVWI